MRTKLWMTTIRFASLLFTAVWLCVPSFCLGQQTPGIGWVTDTVNSRSLGQRTIYVATPDGYNSGESSYPILVMLDANDHRMFQLWIAQAAYLAGNSPGFPPVIAVGIVNGRDRIHDMTPPATGSSVKDFKNAGGAAAFAEFIIDDVLPHVRARYRTLPGVYLIGHSAGGLFALDVAARRPAAFQGVIATSPAIWFNDGTVVDLYVDLMSRSNTHPRLFVANQGGEGDLVTACKRFGELVNAKASLSGTFAYRAYTLSHTMTPMSVGDGLQFIFDSVSFRHLAIKHIDLSKVDSVSLAHALDSSESTYATAARSLGLSDRLPEQILNGLGYDLMSNAKGVLAISVFKRNVRAYPKSPNVYDSLGDGFLAAGDTTSALSQFRRAAEIAHEIGVQVHPDTQRKLNMLEGKN